MNRQTRWYIAIGASGSDGPPMSYTVADALQKQGGPFLFTTGYDKLAIPQHYVGVPRVHKPYGQEEVVERLLDLLSASPA